MWTPAEMLSHCNALYRRPHGAMLFHGRRDHHPPHQPILLIHSQAWAIAGSPWLEGPRDNLQSILPFLIHIQFRGMLPSSHTPRMLWQNENIYIGRNDGIHLELKRWLISFGKCALGGHTHNKELCYRFSSPKMDYLLPIY